MTVVCVRRFYKLRTSFVNDFGCPASGTVKGHCARFVRQQLPGFCSADLSAGANTIPMVDSVVRKFAARAARWHENTKGNVHVGDPARVCVDLQSMHRMVERCRKLTIPVLRRVKFKTGFVRSDL